MLTFINLVAYLASIVTIIDKFKTGNAGFIISGVVITGALILNMIIMVTIALFFKFHIGLVMDNQTTLETLELKRQGKDPDQEPSEFNIGTFYFTQVLTTIGSKSLAGIVALGGFPSFCRMRGPLEMESSGHAVLKPDTFLDSILICMKINNFYLMAD